MVGEMVILTERSQLTQVTMHSHYYYRAHCSTSGSERAFHINNETWPVCQIHRVDRRKLADLTFAELKNSEYPNFFTKLYQLLDDDLLHVRYRPRFMRMLDVFLASP
jgi:hypothetical protein